MLRRLWPSLVLCLLLAACASPALPNPATPTPIPVSPSAPAAASPLPSPSATRRPATLTAVPPAPTASRTSPPPATLTLPAACLGAPPMTLRVGQAVMVSLDPPIPSRVRATPGRSGELVGEVGPGEFVVVEAGPECADGYLWWRVRSEKGLVGWTVEGDASGYWLVTPTPPPAATPAPALSVSFAAASPLFRAATQATVPACVDANNCFRVLPAYTSARLDGYVVAGRFRPEIRVYPAADYERLATSLEPLRTALAANDTAYRYGRWLNVNAAQVLQAQLRGQAFQNGTGVRFLAHFAQAVWPFSNDDLTYIFVGLTADGAALVTVTLPVQAPTLPADGGIWQTGGLPPIPTLAADNANVDAALQAILAFNDRAAAELETLSADAFTPGLAQLDALIAALRVGP